MTRDNLVTCYCYLVKFQQFYIQNFDNYNHNVYASLITVCYCYNLKVTAPSIFTLTLTLMVTLMLTLMVTLTLTLMVTLILNWPRSFLCNKSPGDKVLIIYFHKPLMKI